jgi:hypothetical protein
MSEISMSDDEHSELLFAGERQWVEMKDDQERPLEQTDITNIPAHFRNGNAPTQTEILQGVLDQVTAVTPGYRTLF